MDSGLSCQTATNKLVKMMSTPETTNRIIDPMMAIANCSTRQRNQSWSAQRAWNDD